MRSTKLLLLILLSMTYTGLFSQTWQIAIDHYGNCYTIDGSTLTKTFSNNKQTQHYDLPASNFISSIDISNPLRILIFSKEFNSVLFLDNQLSPLGDAFLLEEKGIYNTPVACYASRGGFWIYDGAENKIKHIDSNGLINIESGQLPASNQDPVFMKEYKSNLYLGFAEKGILIFNTYAAYIKTLPLKHDLPALITDSYIIFSKGKDIFIYDRDRKSVV